MNMPKDYITKVAEATTEAKGVEHISPQASDWGCPCTTDITQGLG